MTTPHQKPAEIRPRNLRFALDEDLPKYWHSGDPGISHFFDGMSIMFPEGERYFMDSVRHFKDEIDDPVLQEHIKGFLRQEAIHGREHETYNDLLKKNGLKIVERLERGVEMGLNIARKSPKIFQLADTAAVEHFTAILGHALLSDKNIMKGAHPVYQELWTWHAVEETEHKAVAFDVFKTVAPGVGGYFIRIFAMIFASIFFPFGIVAHHVSLMASSGELLNFKSWAKTAWFIWGKPGFVWKALPHYFAYYRPSFNPWDQQNYHFVEEWNDGHSQLADDKGEFAGSVAGLVAAE